MSEYRDIEWLRHLHAELWPSEKKRDRIKLDAERELTKDEWDRVKQVITEHRLVTELICTSMFGGIGIRVYRHPIMPGDDHEHVFTMTQEHLPGPTRHDHLMGRDTEEPDFRKPTGGNCSRVAHGMFAEFACTEDNRRWLKDYGLQQPEGPERYDY